MNETRSLFAIGAVVDVNGLTASFVTSAMTGAVPSTGPYAVIASEDHDLAIDVSGDVIDRMSAHSTRCECS